MKITQICKPTIDTKTKFDDFFDAFQVAVVDIQIPREMKRYREEGRTQMGHLKIDV